MDCCYSAGLDRNSHDFAIRCAPGFESCNVIEDAANAEIESTRAVNFWTPTATQPSLSHILLAACSEDGVAKESNNLRQGVFTAALLDKLKNGVTDRLTYRMLIEDLPLLKVKRYVTLISISSMISDLQDQLPAEATLWPSAPC